MAETLKVGCPKCKTVMSLGADSRGKRVKCPQCAALISIPAGSKAPAGKAAAPSTVQKAPSEGENPAATIPLAKPGEEEEWGVINSYEIERTLDKPRCPFCAHDLKEKQTVCLNCGYDLMKRDRHNQRVLEVTSGQDYFVWWLPAIGCLLVIGACITVIVMMLVGSPDFGQSMNWLQRRAEDPNHPKWGYVYGCVAVGALLFICARFAVKRLVLNPHPPEREKHLHKEFEED